MWLYLAITDDGSVRAEALIPAVHRRLLVQVTIEQDGVTARKLVSAAVYTLAPRGTHVLLVLRRGLHFDQHKRRSALMLHHLQPPKGKQHMP